MRDLIRQSYDKVCFGLALAAAGLSTAWCGWQRRDAPNLTAEAMAPVLSSAGYVAGNWRAPNPAVGEWPAPVTQPRGAGWLYEVFTPPVISYNPTDGSFAVAAPPPALETDGAKDGLELPGVRRQPYRLQLVGYLGEAGNYLAAFTSPRLPETLLARPGCHFAELGLTFRSLDVRQVIAGHNEAGPVWEVAAFAVLHDEASGTEVVLDSRTRRFADPPPATAAVARSETTFSSP
jgi:hypothetical protein